MLKKTEERDQGLDKVTRYSTKTINAIADALLYSEDEHEEDALLRVLLITRIMEEQVCLYRISARRRLDKEMDQVQDGVAARIEKRLAEVPTDGRQLELPANDN